MHVGGITVDRTWLLQLIFTLLVAAAGLHRLVKNTASKYFEVGANFEGGRSRRDEMSRAAAEGEAEPENRAVCAICGNPGNKKCSRCKSVRYCSSKCQEEHWKSGHKLKCKEYGKINSSVSASTSIEFKASSGTNRSCSGIALVPASGTNKSTKKPRDVLFPYDKFIKLYNWDKPGFPPCGLLNRGNSCFANVVLQCLTYTRPLVAYLFEKGHRRECRCNDWCFLCKFQDHVERVSQSSQAFSPLNILSCLPSFSGNLCYGKQEDAHEFMRIAIDTMQSLCLDEFGGEKAVPLSSQETTLIQHIFGGQLLSQVTCTECNKVSNQLENMMDLTVEIHGEVGSLEECLDQFTAKEWLHGDNMYKCDGCNDYVKACKRLTIQRAPNILTIALKRFRSGRFGKLNKRVTFPEMLDLSSYMSEDGDGSDVYKLYAVIVHLDMLNASFFGHYICYTKDFRGNWYRIDDCKVTTVALEEVLSQGAYMLLYSRVSVRPSCLKTVKPSKELQPMLKSNFSSCTNETKECYSPLDLRAAQNPGSQAAESSSHSKDSALVNIVLDSVISNGVPTPENGSSEVDLGVMKPSGNIDASGSCSSAAIENLRCQNGAALASTDRKQDPDPEVMNTFEPEPDSSTGTAVPMEVSDCEDDLCAGITAKADVMDDLFNAGRVNWESSPTAVKVNGTVTLPGEASSNSTRSHKLKREWALHGLEADNGNGMKRAEISNDY